MKLLFFLSQLQTGHNYNNNTMLVYIISVHFILASKITVQQSKNMKVNKKNLRFQQMQESDIEHIFNLVNDAYR